MSSTVARQAVRQTKGRLSTENSQWEKEVDIPDHLKSRTDQADFRNAFMPAIGNDATVFSFMKTPAPVTGDSLIINSMTARRGFISPRGVGQAGGLAGRPLGKQSTFLVRHLR